MSEDESADEGDAEESTGYDPSSPTPPLRAPPLRSTAPQSEYTMGQVGFGFAVLVLGVVVTFGLPLLFG